MSKTSRRNIFDLMNERYDIYSEIVKISELIEDHVIKVTLLEGHKSSNYSVENFVDQIAIHRWKNNRTFINCEEIRNAVGIDDVVWYCRNKHNIEMNKILNYIEYVLNLVKMCEKSKNECMEGFKITFNTMFYRLIKNIEILLDYINYEYKYFEKEEKVLLFEKKYRIYSSCRNSRK